MAKTQLANDEQKSFAKVFDVLCRSRSRWKAWSEFVHMAACAISNAVDAVHKEEREREYGQIARQYTKEEMKTVAELLNIVIYALEANCDQDFLGDMYMRLNLGNEQTGQFFTPYDVSKMMARMNVSEAAQAVEKDGYATVCDCCVGGGAMLIAFANACRDSGVNFQKNVLFVGQDIDPTVAMMAYIQLSLLGCPGYVVIGNSLTEPLTGDTLFAPIERRTFVTPMYCSDVWEARRRIRAFKKYAQAAEAHAPVAPAPEQGNKNAQPIQLSIFDRVQSKGG